MSRVSARAVASSLLLGVERLVDRRNLLNKFEILTSVHSHLSDIEKGKGFQEIGWLAIYVSTVVVREVAHSSKSASMHILHEMSELYNKSLAFRDFEPMQVSALADEYVARLETYDQITIDFVRKPEHRPDRWFLALAKAAEEHCYGSTGRGDAALELVLMIGYLNKVLHELLKSTLTGAQS